MHVHILGICGTFMGGIALLAKQKGFTVTGSDSNVYPPMSTQLEEQGITLTQGFDVAQLEPRPDLVVIGNAMSRGNPCVEHILNYNLPFCSGPEFLVKYISHDKWVLGVSGTHGKTTTSSMLAWILEYAGMAPGFLIGGVAQNFGLSARLSESPFFVIEADEYDSAFFDKRSKFVHYRPKTLGINNLEFDHADIFKDLEAIQVQFHHVVRTVASLGQVIYPSEEHNIQAVIDKGVYCDTLALSPANYQLQNVEPDGSKLALTFKGESIAQFGWSLIGEHNRQNALMALMMAKHVGVDPKLGCEALTTFQPPKRRLETLYNHNDIVVFDDFAHHPTAIASTLAALRAKHPDNKIVALLEPRSATMKLGTHKDTLADALKDADVAYIYQPSNLDWQLAPTEQTSLIINNNLNELRELVLAQITPSDRLVIMSNGGFDGVASWLVSELEAKYG